MDPSRFDTLTRQFGDPARHRANDTGAAGRPITRRRGLVAAFASLVGLAAADGAAGASATPTTAAPAAPSTAAKRCLRNGTRCNRRSGGPGDPCRRCCSGFSEQRPGGKGRRCACAPAGQRCRPTTQCCGQLACVSGTCAPPPPLACGAGGPCTVFLTTRLYNGNLGGLAGADAQCQELAELAGSLAPAGTYRAWLSTSVTSPAARFYQSPEPYVLVDGTQVAANWAALIDSTTDLANPISLTEAGTPIADGVWTNTFDNGNPSRTDLIATCNDWTTDSAQFDPTANGRSDRVDAAWTRISTSICSSLRHLYCFQQD